MLTEKVRKINVWVAEREGDLEKVTQADRQAGRGRKGDKGTQIYEHANNYRDKERLLELFKV